MAKTEQEKRDCKAASARNNAIHYLYARKFTILPEWHDQCTARATELTRHFADPVERGLRHQWTYLGLWIRRLDTLEDKLCRLEIHNAQGDTRRGIAAWVHHNPLSRTIQAHRRNRQARRQTCPPPPALKVDVEFHRFRSSASL